MIYQSSLFEDREYLEYSACNLIKTVIGVEFEDAKLILDKVGGIHKLAQAHESVLATLPKVGLKRAAKLKAMTKWAILLSANSHDQRPSIRCINDVANLVMTDMSLLEKEELRVIILDTKHNVRCIETIYVGAVNKAVIRIAEVFRAAIMHNATSIILVHNHPSGDPTPSPEDVHVTKMIQETGKELDIELCDHVIIGANRYVSLKERGLAFT